MRTGSSFVKPCASWVVTVATNPLEVNVWIALPVVEVKSPTILNSGVLGSKSFSASVGAG